jgi:hypothetical protein
MPSDAPAELVRSLSAAIGGLTAGLLEYALVGYSPAAVSPSSRAMVAALGLAGLGLALFASIGLDGGSSAGPAAAIPLVLGALWALLAVPALALRMGTSQERDRSR